MHRVVRSSAAWSAVLLVSACAGGGGEDAGPAVAPIDVPEELEQQMCENLTADYGTSPIEVEATADPADADAIAATPGKKPVVLTAFGNGTGGYLRLTLDPAAQTPVILMFDEPMSFQPLLEDGTEVELVGQADGSDLCDAAEGRYTWRVSGGTNYLMFFDADCAAFNLVLETVE